MKQLLWQNLPILRFLAGLWGWLTIIIFILDFFNGHLYKSAITNIAIIYGAILAMYVGSKEYRRWKEKKAYQSKHWGELYVVAWTVLMVFFVVLNLIYKNTFTIPPEFPAVSLTVLSVFILSRESKEFASKK